MKHDYVSVIIKHLWFLFEKMEFLTSSKKDGKQFQMVGGTEGEDAMSPPNEGSVNATTPSYVKQKGPSPVKPASKVAFTQNKRVERVSPPMKTDDGMEFKYKFSKQLILSSRDFPLSN